MANSKEFTCSAGTFTIDEAINGQAGLTFYDPLKQIALRPSLREGTILCYWKQGVEGLLSQIQSQIGSESRVVKTNPYYWTEYCSEETITTIINKSLDAIPAAGGSVTATINTASYSKGGKFSRPKEGYRAYIKELNNQAVNIGTVTKSVAGAHTMVLTPVNGEVLDLTKFDQYTLLVDQLKMYVKGTNTCITGSGVITTPPVLRKGYIQKFEDMIPVHEDEIDGYAYENEFMIFKGLSSRDGKAIEQWCAPQVQDQLLTRYMDSKIINTLVGVRDDKLQQGFDGIVTTAQTQGAYNSSYEVGSGVSLRQILMNNIRTLRKTNGCSDILMLNDWSFGIDWSEGIAAMVGDKNQQYKFALFGDGGKGNMGAFEWYQFDDFKAFGYQFRSKTMDIFDSQRYGSFLEYFSMTMPGCQYRDTNNKAVAPVTYVNIANCEPAKDKNMWVDDGRERGCREVKYFIKASYGLEIHCASKLGILRRAKCA